MKKSEEIEPTPITTDNPPKAPAVAPPPSVSATAQTDPYREDPGQALGIVGLVMNVAGILPGGIVFGVLSRNKSRQAGFPTTLGTIAMVWGIIGTVLGALAIIAWLGIMVLFMAAPDGHSQPQQSQNPDYSYSGSSDI